MEIEEAIVNWLKFPKEVVELALAPYLEMPKGEHPFVMQHHWRGRSVHVDWRMKANGYLVGWTVLDNPKGTPRVETMEEAKRALKSVPFIFKAKNLNMGRRAETKARQPLDWLRVHGVTKPGDPGATRERIGVISIFEKGVWISGVQKPYFHEYFIKSSIGTFFPKNQWFRIVIRRIGVPVLDPETKKPLKKREAMWRALIPSTQEPYVISQRAMKRKYKPPKTNTTPFPIEWTKKNFSKQYAKWGEYMKGKVEEKKSCRTCFKFSKCIDPETLANPDRLGCAKWVHVDLVKSFEALPFAQYKNFADCVSKNQDKKDPDAYCAFIARKVGEIKTLSPAKFTLHFNSWMGQFVVRGVPKREWYLRIDDEGSGGVRSFFFPRDPIEYQPTSAEDEGRVSRKWLTFEGKIAPRTKYNPNKKISSMMKIVDRGTVTVDSKSEEGVEIISLKFKGKKLRGNWRLVQEEKKAPTYSFEKLSEALVGQTFVLQRHWIPLKTGAKYPKGYGHHWDIRFSNGTELNLYKNPIEAEVKEEIKVKRKTVTLDKIRPWMKIKKEHTRMMVGPLVTFVDPMDAGKADFFELTPTFISLKLHGKILNGYFVWKKTEGKQFFMRAKLPKTEKKTEVMSPSDEALEKAFQKVMKSIEEKASKKEDPEKEKLNIELKKKKIQIIEKWLEANE